MAKPGRKKFGADLSIIIAAAGMGRRMKSHGAKPLIQLNPTENVIQRQVRILTKLFPKAEIIVAVGFQAEKVIKALPKTVKTVENELYYDTSVTRSIGLALKVTSNPNVLIVFGDLVFNPSAFNNVTVNQSVLVTDSRGQIDKEEIGLTVVERQVTRLSYNLPRKFARIAFLNGKELELFRAIACDRLKKRLQISEVFNHIIERGGKFTAIEPRNLKVVGIDCFKDIVAAQRIK